MPISIPEVKANQTLISNNLIPDMNTPNAALSIPERNLQTAITAMTVAAVIIRQEVKPLLDETRYTPKTKEAAPLPNPRMSLEEEIAEYLQG